MFDMVECLRMIVSSILDALRPFSSAKSRRVEAASELSVKLYRCFIVFAVEEVKDS